jgi:hypothetical protein
MDVKAGEILRAIVWIWLPKRRMRDVYSLLRGKNFETREYNENLKKKDLLNLRMFFQTA